MTHPNPIPRLALLLALAATLPFPINVCAQPAAEPAPQAQPAAEPAPPAPTATAPTQPPTPNPQPLAQPLVISPATAERLKLTDEQRVKISNLETERSEALAKAAAPDRPKVTAEFDEKLKALLTDAQRAELAAAPAGEEAAAEPKLKFNFRFQRWSDVLEWFASQANLSLVLDAPPPGTFNYSDSRDYTVAEALDLMNGVLLTKGYALIRRERMLIVVNLADGIPDALVPRIEAAELDKRGKFEIVSMLFTVGDRKVEEVVAEITPLLGARGKSLPLPKTKQILVTDTAGVMRSIRSVIESIPAPSAGAPAESPTLVVYPLKSADADAAIKVLEALLPSGRFVRDPKANQISAYGTAAQHAAVKGVLDQMQTTEGPAGQQARFEVYDLETGDPKQALAALQPLVPGARISVDPLTKKVAAWGTPTEHEVLKKAVEQLGGGASTSDDRQIEVYRLETAAPATTLTLLQSIVPRAKLAVDTPTRSIVALASLADHKVIRTTLEQIDPRTPDPNGPEVRFYPFSEPPPANFLTVITSLVPKAQVTVDTVGKRLTVVATPTDQERVKETLDRFTRGPAGDEKRELVLYPVSAAQRKRFQLVLTDLVAEFPTVKVLTDAEPGELAIWAKPSEHLVIADMIEKLKQQASPEESYRLVAHPIKTADPTSVYTVLVSMFPTTKIVLDPKSRRIVAWTREAEQTSIQSLIEQMDSEAPDEARNQLMIYPVSGFDPTAAITTLKLLAPDATITSDIKASTLVVWARKADQTKIAEGLKRLQPSPDLKHRPHVVAYPVGKSDPNTLYPIVAALVPTARVIPNAKNGTVAVWATPEDHETIRAAIEEMTKEGPLEGSGKVAIYPLTSAEPSSTITTLLTMFPTARITFDPKHRRLVVFGRPSEHEAIKDALVQIDTKPEEAGDRQLKAFPLTGIDPTAAMTILKSLTPETTLTSDTRAGTLVAWGPQAELDLIAPALDRMRPSPDDKSRPRVVAYPVGTADPNVVYSLIAALVPTARVVPNAKAGTVAVWASPEDHEIVRGAVEEVTAPQEGSQVGKVEIYTLKEATATSLLAALQTAVPEARFSVGQNPRKLVAWAKPADHLTIAKALQDLDQEDVAPAGTVLKSYAVTTADVTSLLATLQTLFATRRDLRLSLDAKNNKIVAMATPAQHEAIRGVIDEIERGSPLDAGAELQVHPLRNAESDVVMQVLGNLVTKQSRALLSLDTKARQIIAVAPEAQQAKIRETIERLQSAPRTFEVFQLEVIDPRLAEQAIAKLFVETTATGARTSVNAPSVETDPQSQRLFVRANAEQVGQIRDLLIKMGEANLASAREGSIRVIPFSGDTEQALAEIRRVWPQLSKHPLKILSNGDSHLRGRGKLPENMKRPVEPSAVPPIEAVPAAPAEAPPANRQTKLEVNREVIEVRTAELEDSKPVAPADVTTPVEPTVTAEPVPTAEPPVEASPPKEPAAPPALTDDAPIVVAPGDGKITIMSDDPEAIEQIESLLKALSPPTGAGGRDVMIYLLRSANSSTVAELLNRMFRRSGFDFGGGASVVIESDSRLNAIVVFAGRNDRAAIERVLKVLDSDEVPESLAANRPTLIPVKNTSAAKIDLVLKDVYKTQLTAGSGVARPQIPIPSGATRDVAAVIQQINTAASGPLMTIGIDDTTNSIVVMAPGPLVKEVSELVAELDEASLNDSSRGVKIVKLKSTSAMRVKEILDSVLKDAVRRSASRR